MSGIDWYNSIYRENRKYYNPKKSGLAKYNIFWIIILNSIDIIITNSLSTLQSNKDSVYNQCYHITSKETVSYLRTLTTTVKHHIMGCTKWDILTIVNLLILRHSYEHYLLYTLAQWISPTQYIIVLFEYRIICVALFGSWQHWPLGQPFYFDLKRVRQIQYILLFSLLRRPPDEEKA